MLFDAALQVLEMKTVKDENDPEHLTLVLVVGFSLPVGPGQFIPVPLGALRLPMTGEQAVERGEEMAALGKDTPAPSAPSDIVVASSLQGAEQAAQMDQQFRGGGQ